MFGNLLQYLMMESEGKMTFYCLSTYLFCALKYFMIKFIVFLYIHVKINPFSVHTGSEGDFLSLKIFS